MKYLKILANQVWGACHVIQEEFKVNSMRLLPSRARWLVLELRAPANQSD